MKKIIQRVTSMLLCAVLLLQMVPAVSVHVHAEGSDLVFTKCDTTGLADGLQTGCYYLLVAIVNDGEDGIPVYYTPAAFDEWLYSEYLTPEADGSIRLSEDTTLPLLRYQEKDNGAGLFLRDGSMLYLGEDGHEVLSAEDAAALTEHNIQYQAREDGPGVGFYTEHIGAEGTYYTYLVFETLAEFNVYSNVGTTEYLESAWGFYLYSATLYDHEHVLGNPVGVDAYICKYSCTVEGCDYTENQEHLWDGDWAYLDASGHAKTCTACGYVYTQQHRASYRDLGDGTHSLTCSICNPQTEPEPHQWSRASYDGEQDTHVYLCEQCPAEKNSPLHFWDEAEHLEYPSCDYPGLSGADCTAVDCGATVEWEIAPLGHDLTEWYTAREATDTTHGEQIRYCRNCGESEMRVIPAKNHEHKLNYVEPCHPEGTIGYYACDEMGTTEATSGCYGMYLDAEATQQISGWEIQQLPIEHNWGNWYYPEGDAAAGKGRMIRDCTYDDCEETQQWIDPLVTDPEHAHQMFKVEATESTCTVQGNEEYYICLNEYLYDESGMMIGYQGYWDAEGTVPVIAGEERLPTVAHTDFEWVNEGEDYHSRKCSVCDYEETSSHTYSPYYPANGITETVCRQVCITCGYVEDNTAVDPDDGGDYTAPNDYHTFWDWPVDCGDGEHHTITCNKCGTVFMLEHDWQYNEGYETDEGYVEGWHACMSCYAVYEGEEPHIWVADGEPTPPTCAEEGSQHYICAAEGCEGEKTEFSDPLGHTNQLIPGKDPTCTATGLTDGLLCAVCDTVTKEQEEIPMLEHPDEDGNFFCDECQTNLCFDKHPDANNDYYCDNCQTNLCFDKHPDENNDYYCDNCKVNLCFDEHIAVEVPGKDASCTETGLTVGSECQNCGEALVEQEEIPMLKHPDEDGDYFCDECQTNLCFDGHVVEELPGKDATCTATGLTAGSICKNCKQVLREQSEIPMLEHPDVDGNYYCDECQTNLCFDKHIAVEVPGKDASCTETGLTVGSECQNCGETLVEQEEIPMLEHDSEVIPAVEATCTVPGMTEGSKCKDCGKILVASVETELAPHTEEIITGTSATCTATGLTDGLKCTVCDTVTKEQEEIPVLEHTPEVIPVVPATCVSTGLTEGSKCAVCGIPLAEQQVTDKLPHNIVVVEAKEPTCTVPGQTESQSCNQCGVTFRLPTELPAAGHRWSQWLTSKEPTQTQNGWLLRYCLEGCGAVEKEICPAYGHVHHLVKAEGYDATCNNPGKQTYYRCIYETLAEDEYDDSCGCCFRDAEGTQQVTPGDMVIPVTGKHEMGTWVVEHESDPEFIMYKRTCSCGEVEYRPEPRETHTHTLIYVEAAEPTCTANGAQAHYACTTCPCIFKDAEGSVRMEERDQAILTEGHKYGEWRSDGEYGHSRECTQCDVVQIATKHQESPLPGDPTGAACATACLLCDYQKSNANLHSYKALTACSDRWQHQQSCSACGFELIEDHEFGDWEYGSFVNDNTGESVIGHYRTCECGAMETSVEHLWDEGKETKPGYKIHTCIVDGCGETKEEFLRCMHTCFTCGKCTAETTCPGKESCDCPDPAPLVTTDPTFLTNNVGDPNQTYLGDILVKDQGDDLDPDAKPGQEIPEEYVGLTIGIQEVPLSDEETGEPVENPYTDYVEQALNGYETQHLFDIHLLDAEGRITESSGDAQYLIRLCLDEEIVLGLQKGLLRLAHITEKGTFFYGVTEDCIPFYKLEGNLAWFWADRFSPFALVKPEAPYYGREALATLANKDALLYAYDQIAAGVEACVEKIQIYPDGTTPAVSIPELQMVMDAYTRDHTENFWLESKYSISYKKALNMATAVKPTYSMTGDELAAARAEFNAAADEILHGITEEMSEFDRQLLIHDRLAARVVYDKTLAKPHVHDAYGAMVNGLAVCQGYAEALQYLLRRVGIQSFIVTGYSQDQAHAWNMVRIDGQYYHTDLTWNDQETALYHAYFNIDDHYITEDHAIYTTAYPLESCVGMEANYFTKMQTNLDDLDANSEDAIAQKMKGSINGVSFLLTESVTAEQFLYWFMANQRDIFTKADLINVEVKTPTYTCIGREAMISFVAEDGQPPHICDNGGKVPGQAPACTTAGWKDHYLCSCGKLYAEQSCKTEITNLAAWKMGAGQITAAHTYSALVPAQQAVHTESQMQNGVAAHYRCTVCDEYFTEGKAVTTLSSLTIKPEHVFGDWVATDTAKHWKTCTTCGKKAWEGAHVYTDSKCNTCGYELPKPGLSKPVVAPAGGSLAVTFAWETPITGKVLVAVYDLSGQMLGISYVESDTVDASGKTYTVAYDKSGTPRRIRAFVLKDGFAPALDFDPIELQ